MWDLPGSRIEPLSPAFVGGFFTTGPQGHPRSIFLASYIPKRDFKYDKHNSECSTTTHKHVGVCVYMHVYKYIGILISKKT